MHNGARTLVALVGAYAHPSTVGAVGGRCARLIANVGCKTLHLGQVVPPVDGRLGCLSYACRVLGVVLTDGQPYLSFGNGVELDDVAVACLAACRTCVCAHIIFGCRLQVFQPVNLAVVVKHRGGAVVVARRLAVFGIAETAFGYVLACDALDASEGHRRTTGEARISADNRYGRNIVDVAVGRVAQQGDAVDDQRSRRLCHARSRLEAQFDAATGGLVEGEADGIAEPFA